MTNLPPGLISGLEQASRRRFNEFSVSLSERQELQYYAGKTAMFSFMVDIHGRSYDPRKCRGVCQTPEPCWSFPGGVSWPVWGAWVSGAPFYQANYPLYFYNVTVSGSVNARPEL